MFYDLRITQSLDLEPRHFGPNLRQVLRDKLVEKVSMAAAHRMQQCTRLR